MVCNAVYNYSDLNKDGATWLVEVSQEILLEGEQGS